MHLNWLEPSEEDPLVYTVGNEDNKNSSQRILDIASVDQDGETYILSKHRHAMRAEPMTFFFTIW